MRKYKIIVMLLIGLFVISGLVQASSDILGMGNIGVALPGDNGIEWNPAAMNPTTNFVIDLDVLNTRLWTDSLSVMQVLEYGGLVEGSDNQWDEEDINTILASISDDGLNLNLDLTVRPKIIVGPVGISAAVKAYGQGALDKDFFNLILKGNADYVELSDDGQLTGSTKLFDLTDTGVDALVTADAGVTVSIPLNWIDGIQEYVDECYVGSTFHAVGGAYGNVSLTDETKFYIAYGEPDENGNQIVTIRFADGRTLDQVMNNLEDGEVFPLVRAIYTANLDNPQDTSYLGMGGAIDLGVYARKGNFHFGISAMNNGSMTFTNYQIMDYGVVKDGSGFSIGEPTFTDGTNPLKVPLPSRINAGVSYELGHWLKAGAQVSRVKTVSVTLDSNNEMVKDPYAYSEIGVGVEVNPLWVLPLRVGVVSAKGTTLYTAGLGLHLGPVQTDLSAQANLKGVSVGLNTSIEF